MNAHHKKKILAAASLILLSPMALLAHEGAVTYEKQEIFSSSKKTTHSPLSVSDVRSSTSLSPLLSKYCFLNGDAVISL